MHGAQAKWRPMQERGDTRRNCLRVSRRECTGSQGQARLRLEMGSDRLARQLLNMTTDPNVADPVKLAAIKDALDRSGLAAKTAFSVEVGGKPFEMVFDSIMAGPRNAQPALAIEDENAPAIESNQQILEDFDDPRLTTNRRRSATNPTGAGIQPT